MKVCIAEKPSVAKEIAQVLGAKLKKDGYYEGNGYAVTWTFGHFCTLYAPVDYKPYWKFWNLNDLPMLPNKFLTKLKDDQGIKKQFKVVEKLFQQASVVINCGDAGQEGELIQRWVLKQANYQGPVKRLWISSLTTEAIKDGFKALKDEKDYDNLYYAGSSRAIGDWLLGMNATRLYTLKYAAQKQVLSIGRVQTPTLAMLVKRFKEIENFVPKPYWELQTLYREVQFNCQQGKFQNEAEGQSLLEKVLDKPLIITDSTKKKGKEHPPKLFDLTALQVYCNNKFGYSADQTLKIIQGLYEKKVVTYPRVDTTFLPTDIYPKVKGILQKLNNYSQFTQSILGKAIRKSKKVFDDKKITDHHAIIPTGVQMRLMANEQAVYDIICRRFIAVFYPDCIVSNTTVLAEVEGVKFKATGKEILDQGWRVLFPKSKKKDKDEEKIMPSFQKGESGPHEPSFTEKQTKPPKHYTEATLLRGMETAGKQVEDEDLRDALKANGIGRPSTRAGIIETLFRRKYIQRKRKLLLPTEIGVQLIDLIQNELLKSAELTGQWEKQLKEIEQGEHSPVRFINDMKKMVDQLVFEVRTAKRIQRLTNSTPKKTKSVKATTDQKIKQTTCPQCKKGGILKGKSSYGCSEWNTGCSFRLPFEYQGKKLTENQSLQLLSKGKTSVIKGFVVDGAKMSGKLSFDTNFAIQLEGSASTPKKSTAKTQSMPTCPKCKKGELLKGSKAYGCSEWKNGCDFRCDFDYIRQAAKGKEMTKELVIDILQSYEG